MRPDICGLFATALVIGSVVVLPAKPVAQERSNLERQAENLRAAASLSKKLHLTPQQAQQVLPILKREMPKLQAIKGSSNLSDVQKVAQMKAVQQQSDVKLKTILSPQQFLSLQDFRAQQVHDLVHGTMPY